MDPDALIKRVQSVIYAIRRGQTNQALAVSILALIAAGEYVRREWKEPYWAVYVVYAAYGIAGVCCLWLVQRLWKTATPPPEPAGSAGPSAIKGLLPWSVADGELFTSLGRRDELGRLLDRAQNEQIAITIVRGESGAGKTSLLQAGLQYTLREEICVYWEARPSNAPIELLRAIRNQLPEIESLESLPDAAKCRWVLILDQFEQLRTSRPDHLPLFKLLGRIASEPPPHRISAVVAFRREYQPDWSDFELAYGFRAEQVALSLMTRQVAGDVMATLAGKADLTLEQKLIDNFLINIVDDPSRSDRVSPLDISIGLESLVTFARQRGVDHVTMNDYELAGGAEGLLRVFVQERLEEVAPLIRIPLLNGIVLTLVDLANDQRVAEGSTAEVIATNAGMPVEALKPWLDRLAHPRVRLLESLAPDRYRLPHERLVPVLRRLTGRALASLDRSKLQLESEYARWRQTRSRRNLLSGKELHTVLRYREQLLPAERAAEMAEYLDACLGRRRMLRLTGAGAAAGVAGLAYSAFRAVDTLQQTSALKSWGFPPELFNLQSRLDGLRVSSAINDLSWIRSVRLRELSVRFMGSDLRDQLDLRRLTTLEISLDSSQITSLAGLEKLKGLTKLTLYLGGSRVKSLSGLEHLTALTELTLFLGRSLSSNIGGFSYQTTSLDGLEKLKGLTTLTIDLAGSQMTSLAALPQLTGLSVLRLYLQDSQIASLAGLEKLKGLTTLTLDLGSNVISLAGLEKLTSLTALALDLRTSRVTSLAELKQLPGLKALTLSLGLEATLSSQFAILAELKQLTGLEALMLNLMVPDSTSLAGLEQLTALKALTLRLSSSKVTSLAELKQLPAVTALTLYLGGPQIKSLAGLAEWKRLTTLTLYLPYMSLVGLEQVRGLKALTLDFGRFSKTTSLAGLEKLTGLTTLMLDLRDSQITSLAGLEKLTGLTTLTLDLRDSQITSLAGLEKLTGLTTLTLNLSHSKITSIDGLQQLKHLRSAKICLPMSLVGKVETSAREAFVDCAVP